MASNEAMLSVVGELGVASPLGLAGATLCASAASGLWRLALTPLDTCKTVLQVEGLPGFRAVVAKVCRGHQ